jgi:hypothetical protein
MFLKLLQTIVISTITIKCLTTPIFRRGSEQDYLHATVIEGPYGTPIKAYGNFDLDIHPTTLAKYTK